MSTLLGIPLETELIQEINFNLNTRCHLGAIIPYLLMFNSPAGTFSLSLIKNGITVFSNDFTSADLKLSINTANNYAHVFYPIIPDNPIQIEKGLYEVKIEASGYTYTPASYLGWLQQFEDVQNEMDYVPLDDSQNSLAIRFKEYKEGVL